MNASVRPITGTLVGWLESYQDTPIWTLLSGPDDMPHAIEEGDHLTILAKDGSILWEGVIDQDTLTGAVNCPPDQGTRQRALGNWVCWLQRGVQPDHWAGFFLRNPDERLHGILLRKLQKPS